MKTGVPHNDDNLYGGVWFFLRAGAPLVGIHVGLMKQMK